MKKISLLIPVYNEEESLDALYTALLPLLNNTHKLLKGIKYEWEVILIDDGSSDHSFDKLKQLNVRDDRFKYVKLSRNFGKENALLAGFDRVSGDAMIIMDADLQHPVETIPEMITKWEEGYEDVYGQRLSRGKESIFRKIFTKIYYRLLNKSTRVDVLPNVGDFRLLDRKVIDAIRGLRETQRYTKGLYCWVGFKKTGVDFQTADRVAGKTHMSPGRLVNLALEGITSYTTAPLRIATILGGIISVLAICYMIYIVCKTLMYGEPIQGFPTLICTILFLGGCQLLALGIIGEYIGKIYNESKGRPAYIVAEESESATSKEADTYQTDSMANFTNNSNPVQP
ncbi:MAG: glycosyltransferase family 2 protein [Muribaculaceae bacterium]|nr:glycosyltransferase family 2 protein [Muribaculaceae bacterium]